MSLSYDYSSKFINVPQVDSNPLTMQFLVNSIREEEASERGIVESHIIDASGKDALGSGVSVGITMNLRSSWKLNFAPGSYQAVISGGNLSDALSRINNTGSPQVLVQSSSAGTISTVSTGSGLSVEQDAKLMSLPTSDGIWSNIKALTVAKFLGLK